MEEKTLVCRNGDTFKVWRGYLENDPVRVSVDAEVMTLKKTMKRAENPFILNKMERIAVRVFSFFSFVVCSVRAWRKNRFEFLYLLMQRSQRCSKGQQNEVKNYHLVYVAFVSSFICILSAFCTSLIRISWEVTCVNVHAITGDSHTSVILVCRLLADFSKRIFTFWTSCFALSLN